MDLVDRRLVISDIYERSAAVKSFFPDDFEVFRNDDIPYGDTIFESALAERT